ncbi:NUDIX hydrolase [Halococcus hamelinensis]|uniref:NTP pyrophosphohydrolase n=1 Tax=Halococcus hamelinensis 100A6 TaxID=1132509 RepID=M0M067_9EURY|nr:NUDIX domain-containing protein [Halococcus hamelinensis]EMA39056.1 NTP pyrophosphohydrolase [Halococcus hamelinensis 100A6]
MARRDVNRDEIERRCDRLTERFGDAPVIERRDTPAADVFEEWIELSETGYIGSAYALVRRPPERLPSLTESMAVDGEEEERVLLILGRGGSDWGVPGGGQEDDETMAETVRREVAEEVGIDISLTGIGHMRHEVSTCEGYDERLHVLRVFFRADYVDGSIAIQPGELNGAVWFADPPEPERLSPSTRRLLDGWRTE